MSDAELRRFLTTILRRLNSIEDATVTRLDRIEADLGDLMNAAAMTLPDDIGADHPGGESDFDDLCF